MPQIVQLCVMFCFRMLYNLFGLHLIGVPGVPEFYSVVVRCTCREYVQCRSGWSYIWGSVCQEDRIQSCQVHTACVFVLAPVPVHTYSLYLYRVSSASCNDRQKEVKRADEQRRSQDLNYSVGNVRDVREAQYIRSRLLSCLLLCP